MRHCDWEALTKGAKCRNCDNRLPRDYDKPPIAQCGDATAQPAQPGLGDYTEQLLSSIGITKGRYKQVKKKFGLAPECRCDKVQKWLNRVSDWWQSIQASPEAKR
jgi:hypothetical protein